MCTMPIKKRKKDIFLVSLLAVYELFILLQLIFYALNNYTMNQNREEREELYSKAVRAGKRTYFFDVKATKGGEQYLTITESKRRFVEEDGKFVYEKHKMFLFKEDFDKFSNAFDMAKAFINGEEIVDADDMADMPNIDFDDLD